MMLAIHEQFAAQAKPLDRAEGTMQGQASMALTLEPEFFTVWRRKHDIKPGFAPHMFTGVMQPEEPPPGVVRVGYSDRVDDPTEAGYEYVGFAYRAILHFDKLPVIHGVQVLDASLILHDDETVWQLGENHLERGFSTASQLLILDAPAHPEPEAFFTPAYSYTALPQQPGKWGKGEFTDGGDLVVNVTAIVQDWMSGRLPNYGFMLIGPDELFEHDNNRQESLYGELRLVVHYTKS
jgi:hypothetical protein